MNAVFRSLEALPFGRIGRHPDLVLAIAVSAIVAMMILPLPSPVVDTLLALNLALSAIILVAALLSEKPLAISTFPSLLLITTLFRLALNISTTRGILARGTAGEVVRAFGEFVLRGDVVVGLVIFLVITLVQFMVIAKGAERVAEVGARFTLDAMPGKQMAIDAAVRAGTISEEEGQVRRDELGREAQFHGAMDGAMKFIKGDAIAGLIICALNLVAGFAIGVLRNGMSLAQAAQAYSVLTVGDGLVSQIPALLITLASGVLATRVATSKPKRGLGGALQDELLSSTKVLGVGAGLSLALGLIPGLPLLPFAIIAASLAATVAVKLKKEQQVERASREVKTQSFQKSLEQRVKQAKAQRGQLDAMAPTVAPIGLDLDPVLSQSLGFADGVSCEDCQLIAELIPDVRDALYLETGVRFPGVRVRSDVRSLRAGGFVVRVNDVPIMSGVLPTEGMVAFASPESLKRLGVDAKEVKDSGLPVVASVVPALKVAALKDAGVGSGSIASFLSIILARVLRRQAKSFIGLQETAELLERLQKVCPSLVKEVVPKIVTVAQLADVLKRLVDEGISIRDMKSILESLAVFGPHETNSVALTECVRGALSTQIAHGFSGSDGRLQVVVLDDLVEDTVRAAVHHAPAGSYLVLEPELRLTILTAMLKTLTPVLRAGVRPVLLTSVDVRRYVRKLIEDEIPEVSVLSYQELPSQHPIQPLGRVTLQDVRVAA